MRTWAGPIWVGLLVFVLALAPVPSALAIPDPSSTAQNVGRDLGLQQDLPDKNLVAAPEATQDIFPLQAVNFLGDNFLRILLIVAIAAGIGFALWIVRDRLPILGRRSLVARDAAEATGDASVERMAVAQMEADELARQGRAAEAMHALLLRSLIEVRRRLNVSFADSLTSREVLDVLSLPDIGKTSLADIIQRVELVYFGDHHADDQDYAACRRSYEQLTRAMQARFAPGVPA